MAVPSTEVEVLKDGIEQESPSKGAFALNMIYRRNAWEVRKGFGQVLQRTTTFGLPTFETASTQGMGIRGHLGSYLLETDFGHLQCLSIFSALVRTGDTTIYSSGTSDFNNSYTDYVLLLEIDDLTTGARWEEPLYHHTSQNTGFGTEKAANNAFGAQMSSQLAASYVGVPPPFWHGVYETNEDNDRTGFRSGLTRKAFFFHEWKDALYFGNEDTGIYVYRPIAIGKTERRALRNTEQSHRGSFYSERSFVRPLVPTPNPVHQAAFAYMGKADFPGEVVDVAVIDDRLVVASDRPLYFSDENHPGNFIAINQVSVPGAFPVVAIEEHLGHLMIFTERETYIFRAAGGALYGGGQISRVDENVGCLGPNAVTMWEGNLAWADRNGIYVTSGNLVVTKISAGIDSFFNGYFSSPLTSYYDGLGFSDTSDKQPQTTFRVTDRRVHLCYNAELGAVFATFPDSSSTFCFSEGRWSLWKTETQATSEVIPARTDNKVVATKTITNPWLLSTDDDLLMVGTLDEQTWTDSADDSAGAPIGMNLATSSYYVMRYGRGGAIDRNVFDEDQRKPTGYYRSFLLSAGRARSEAIVGAPERVPTGYAFPDGDWTIGASTYSIVRPEDEIYWIPVSLVTNDATKSSVEQWNMTIRFDQDAWEPVLYANNSDIDFFVPSERVNTKEGYNPGAGNASGQVRLSGSNINIDFDENEDPFTRRIYLTTSIKNLMMYIPMRRKEAAKAGSLSTMVWDISTTSPPVITNASGSLTLNTRYWQEYFLGTNDARREDNVAMTVDWAYKTKQVNINEQTMAKARGLYIRTLSHGPADTSNRLADDYAFGLLNTLLAADEKGWISQVVDFTGVTGVTVESIDKIAKKSSIRTRVRDSGSTLVNKTFGQAGVTYGSDSVTSDGNYLIDSQEVDIIATSDSVKGFTFSYMLFGHIQNRAQALRLESVKAALRPAGSRRRTGH